jgi:hypothetical protein
MTQRLGAVWIGDECRYVLKVHFGGEKFDGAPIRSQIRQKSAPTVRGSLKRDWYSPDRPCQLLTVCA